MTVRWRTSYLPKKTFRRAGVKRERTLFIVAHDTGNPGSTANGNVAYYHNSANSQYASAHLFVDDREIVECIPLDEKAWHVLYDRTEDNRLFGDDANDAAIGVELCFGGMIDNKKAYANYVDVIIKLLVTYHLQPKHVIGHMHLDPGRKTDPLNSFQTFGKTWNDFMDDIKKEYDRLMKPPKPKKKSIVKKVVSKVAGKVVKSNKKTYVEVTYPGRLIIRDKPDFTAPAVTHAKRGEVFTVVKTVKSKQGTKMYQLASGLYVTASTDYVKTFSK